MRFFIITFIGFQFINVSDIGAQKLYEKDYVNIIHSILGGEKEASVTSGRVDLLTKDYAYEIEWANKWKNAIGQSVWYAMQTNRKPAIILILTKDSDYKYFLQLNSALDYTGLSDKILVQIYPNDFP